MEKIIIVGSGPAGHTAAIYTGRALLKPLLYEGFMAGGVAAGGQLTTTTEVENYSGFPDGISGMKLMDLMRTQSLNCGARIKTQTIDKVDLTEHPFKAYVEGEVVMCHSLIIATGATAKRLHLPSEEKFWQKGISACAVCDGALPLFRDKPLVVIGGGDSACEEALFLTKYARVVYLLHRRNALRASKIMQNRVLSHDKIKVLWHTVALDVDGEQTLKSLTIKNVKNESEEKLSVNGLFYAIGHTPNTAFLAGQINLDEDGYIQTTPGSTHTNLQGVFAAGDVQDKKYRQAITSAGSGCQAALDAEHYLQANNL